MHTKGRFAQLKIRIRNTEAERKERLFPDRVKIAVTDIHALRIRRILFVAELDIRAVIFPRSPGRRQLAGGVSTTQQHVRQRAPHLGAELREHKDIPHRHHRA